MIVAPETTTLSVAPGWMPNWSRTAFGSTNWPLEESFMIGMAYLIELSLTKTA